MSQAPSPRILPCDPRLQHQVASCVLISVEMGSAGFAMVCSDLRRHGLLNVSTSRAPFRAREVLWCFYVVHRLVRDLEQNESHEGAEPMFGRRRWLPTILQVSLPSWKEIPWDLLCFFGYFVLRLMKFLKAVPRLRSEQVTALRDVLFAHSGFSIVHCLDMLTQLGFSFEASAFQASYILPHFSSPQLYA